MNSSHPIASVKRCRLLRRSLLILTFLLPAILSAQDVPVTVGGIISISTGIPPVYNGQYVIQTTDFGFLWLDTAALPLRTGLVQAEAKCGVGQPPSSTNLYVIGDCNGTGDAVSSGGYVLVHQYNSQCGTVTKGCGGTTIKGPFRLTFALGTWTYLGDGGEIPNSTQAADPQGRTWAVAPTDSTGRNFNWHATGGQTTPPTAAATATNKSIAVRAAAGRPDNANYYGDQWQLQDTSSSGSAITNVDWDLLYKGTYAKDEGGPPPGESTITGFFPCDPNGPIAGDFRLGTNCWQSLGFPTTIPSNGSYQFAMQSANQYGTSANVFVSSSIAVQCPQVNIVGYTGFNGTCAKTAGTLNVLIGGSADARGSNGNPVSFDWNFTGSNPISVSGAVVPVPSGATGFTLTITYPGGYQATAAGAVVQADLVAAFSLAPNPVLINTPLTLTNQMQKASGATLNSVDYLINPAISPGTCGAPPPIAANPLASTFLSGSLTATVNAPGTKGDYCIYLRYNYTPSSGGSQSQTVSNAFTATDWVANPIIDISPLPICGASLCPQIGTAYSIRDSENILLSPHPGAQWDLLSSSGAVVSSIGTSTDANVAITWTPAAACSSCILRLTVNAVSATLPVTISSGSPNPTPLPTPLPTPTGGSLSVSISGPSSGSKGVPLTFTANASGGSGNYSYQWQCDFNPLSVFTPLGQTATCNWAASGQHNVKAMVRDQSTGLSALSSDYIVTIAGLPSPSVQYSLTGSGLTQNIFNGRWSAPTGTALTFTSSETSASSWSWNFGDGTASGRTVTHTFGTSGPYAVTVQITGDEVTTSGTASTTINIDITGPPAPSTAYTITGATQTGPNAYTAEAGRNITFAASATQASGFSWDFGDETKSGRTATKNFSTTGPKTVKLTATGDGVNTVGTATVSIAMTITPATFRAVIVPGVAHLDDGTTTWGTDVSISNSGTTPLSLGGAFVPFVADAQAPASLDLTQLTYPARATLVPGGSVSVRDIVSALGGGNNKGTFVVSYTGGPAPLVTARVYFQPKVNPNNVSYGSGLPAYEVDGAGGITPQGYVSTALSRAPAGVGTDSEDAVLDVAITVIMSGTGSGTVASNPEGINCPATCSFSFPVGTVVTLSGSAAPGSTFAGITGCDVYPLGACTVTSSKTVTAVFNSSGPPSGPTTFAVSVGKSGTGTGTVSSSPSGISCGSTCSATFSQGTTASLTATPDTGSSFTGWGGACSGTGSCVVSADASVSATFTASASPPATPQGDQYLIGLRSDPRYRFVVTLFNASGTSGDFQLEAYDDLGSNVNINDGAGNRVKFRKFVGLRPYQQIYLRDADLGLVDGKFYVLKATRTSSTGTLLAFGTTLDKATNDLVQISDDSQASSADANGSVSYWIAGVSHLDRNQAARWRTDLRVFNRGSKRRNLDFEYSYNGTDGVPHLAHVYNVPIEAGGLLTYDDVVSTLMIGDTSVDLSGDSAGILKISYPEDLDSATKPLVIGSRNYDDQPTGTAGSQLAVYTSAQTGIAGRDLFLTGVEDSDRYRSVVGVFALDPGPINFRIVVVDPNGVEVGSFAAQLGGSGARWGQLDLTSSAFNFVNPGVPVSIRVEQISGGRLGAYAFTVDKFTLDTNFIQALPQN